MPIGPHSFGEQAVKGQNRERVLTFNAAQMCIGPVLEEIKRSRALKLTMASLKGFPLLRYSIPSIFSNSFGGSLSVTTTTNFSLAKSRSINFLYSATVMLGADLPLVVFTPTNIFPSPPNLFLISSFLISSSLLKKISGLIDFGSIPILLTISRQ